MQTDRNLIRLNRSCGRVLHGVYMLLSVFLLSACQSYENDNSRTPGEFTDDVYIQAAVKTALVRDKEIDGLDINVEVRKGVVTVYGPVKNEAERSKVKELSLSVRGVKEFVDRLTLVEVKVEAKN